MDDVIVGLVTGFVGAMFCFYGYLALRVMIPIWGALSGFMLGAGLVAEATDERFLTTLMSWLVGLGVGVLFGLLAYLFYEISVLFAMTAIGFAIGSGLMVALDVRWSWLVTLVGMAFGLVLAFVAIVADLPTVVLIVLSSMAGAVVAITGVLLVFGELQLDDFNSNRVSESLDLSWWWYVIYAAIVIIGIVSQVRQVEQLRSTIRGSWVDAGGRTIRDRDDLSI